MEYGMGPVPAYEWDDDWHRLFRVYRDTLRRIWISDPTAVEGGSLLFLFGLQGSLPGGLGIELQEAVKTYGRLEIMGTVFPDWKSGSFKFNPQNDFQGALYLLFRESWRAKVCAKCSSYFIAEKPARLYCSVECSNSSHRKAALKWWKEKGAKRRRKAVE
jgi:hypothetical protein